MTALSLQSANDVLDRVLARIAEAPEGLAAILRESPEPLLAFSAERKVLCANEALERFFGYWPHELDGRSIDLLVPERLRRPDASPPVHTRDLASVEIPGLRKDGTEAAVVWTYGSATAPTGSVFVMLVHDRDELLADLAALRRADARYRGLLLASAAMVWVTSPEGEFTELQPAWEAYTGQSWEQYRGSRWISAIHPDDRPRVLQDWRKCVRSRSDLYQTHGRVWSAAHAGWRTFQARGVPVRDRAGEIIEWVGALTNVQDAVDAHQRLHETEALYSVLFDKSPFPIALNRVGQNKIVAVNEAFLQLFGARREDVINSSAVAAGLTTLPQTQEVLGELDTRGYVRNYECERVSKTGERLHLSVSLNRVHIDGEEHVLCVVQDIEARKAQDAALARALEDEKRARFEAEAANRAKDEFLATMSHELRTPLNSILGWATILRARPTEDPKIARGLATIERNARAQERLVSDLLDMSRIISGNLRLTVARTALYDVVNSAAEVMRPAADSKGVRLTVEIEPGWGSLVGDPARLQQVVWNLLVNAIRYTAAGGEVQVTADQTGSTLRLRVRDSGIGIGPEHLPFIFDRFRQVDSTTTRAHGGLGLGLAIVRYLVEAHGGSVRAESDGIGHGSTFLIELPVRALEPSTPVPEAVSSRPRSLTDETYEGYRVGDSARIKVRSTPDLAGVHALVVEDDADSLLLLEDVLKSAGARVTAVATARDALAEPGAFDVIVSDVGMPEMDGYDLLREIRSRADGVEVPAIALTAYASESDVARASGAGYQEHLAKPADPAKLLDAVARWTRRPRAAAE